MRIVAGVMFIALTVPACAGPALNGDPYALMERADQNGDTKVSRQEVATARERLFQTMDRNGDGVLDSRDKPRRARMRDAFNTAVASADANSDGAVTQTEFLAMPTAAFDRADIDGDGYLTRVEIVTARNNWQRP